MTKVKEIIQAIAMAAIERLGKESPASVIATDTFLLKDIAKLLKEERITKIMACGGGTSGGTRTAEIFEIEKNEWRRVGDMQHPREGLGLASVDGKVFAIGGWSGNDAESSASVEVFEDEKREGWKEVAKMRNGHQRPGVCVVEGRIIVIGGTTGGTGTYSRNCEAFDIAENRWESLPPMPTARYDMGIAVIRNKIIVLGGRGNTTRVDCVEVFDVTTNEWTRWGRMPKAIQGMGVVVQDERFIWTFGGFGESFQDLIQVLDLQKNEWTELDVKMPVAQFGTRAILTGEVVFLIGGRSREDSLRTVEVFNTRTRKFEEPATPMQFQRGWHAAVGY